MSHFVGREEDIHNITGYLDFSTSDVQVVHIVGPPGFGKSTLAMKIGELFVRKSVNVFYADLRIVKDVNSMSEMIMLSIVDSLNRKVTLKRLEKWVRNQHSNTLVILDNCDELIEHSKEEFLDAIRSLTLASSRRNVRYVLTSQKWVADIGNFRLHPIYNLSSEAAIELLGIVAPSLTDNQKIQIAGLTGNVPLALDVVGAIFVFPVAPTPEEVIEGLRKNLIATLSPDELHTKVDVSIGVAYSYLTPELKQLCVNLSHFIAFFDKDGATFIFNFKANLLDVLVQRSLLQYYQSRRYYIFHNLLKTFFLQRNSIKSDVLLQYFSARFQLYYAEVICQIIPENGKNTDLNRFYDEDINIFQMIILFIEQKDVNNTFYAIKVISNDYRMPILSQLLPPVVPSIMFSALNSYTCNERASVESFLETYIRVLILKARSETDTRNAIFLLWLEQIEVEIGYHQRTLSLNMYTKFYRTLGQYYEEIGDRKQSTWCHTHILRTTWNQLQHCYPECDYFSVSVAYDNIGDREKAFHFRKLAYRHQRNLEPMGHAKLLLGLYNDYLDSSLGNNIAEAEKLSASIDEIYPYLLVADISDYSEDVYFAAIDFFNARNMEQNVLSLQEKMFAMSDKKYRCNKNDTKCFDRFSSVINKALRHRCFHLVILLGKKIFPFASKVIEFSYFVGMSYYSIGNYSESQKWLTTSLELVNDALQKEYSLAYRTARLSICYHLMMSGNITTSLCYGYIIKDAMSLLADIIIHEIQEKYILGTWREPEVPSTVTALMVETQSFIWYQLADRLEYALKHKWDDVKSQTSLILSIMERHSLIIVCFFFLFSPFVIAIILVYIITGFMHVLFCSEKQIACCMSCFSLCIYLSIFITVIIYLFVIFLDLLY